VSQLPKRFDHQFECEGENFFVVSLAGAAGSSSMPLTGGMSIGVMA
jgi:hypothetical protein